MKSFRTRKFKSLFAALPEEVQATARKAYRLWLTDPRHPLLHFKQVEPRLWSVRITLQYRAMGIAKGDDIYRHWIGSHAEYDRLT